MVSETLLVGYDEADNGDEAVLTIVRAEGSTMKVVKTIVGTEAIKTYQNLTTPRKY